jgi:hypothetical protein
MTSAIKNISSTTTFFENKITWERTLPIDSYKILKEYVEFDSWVEEQSFTDWYAIPSNSSHLITSNSFVTFIDTDLSFNEIYRYVITPVNGVTTYAPENVVIYTQSGNISDLKHNYSQNDASFNITWSLLSDITVNTELTWDISWTEISGNPIQSHYATFPINDQSLNVTNRQRKVYLHDRPYLYADASYNYQINGTYTNTSNISWTRASNAIQITPYSTMDISTNNVPYGPRGNFYNYKKPPVLNTVSTGDNLGISWTSSSTSSEIPDYYDISLSHVTIPDISYNIRVTDGLTLTDPSRNVQNYYPGNYNIRVKSGYGYGVPVVNSLFSEWSSGSSFNIPYHAATNFEAVSTNSKVKLTWKNPIESVYMITSYPIPESYDITRRTANKQLDYVFDISINILSTDVSHNDTVGIYPRIYAYDLSANYNS